MTIAAALTAPQLAKLRTDRQFTRLGLAFPAPATVYSALVNQSFVTHDLVAQVAITAGVGTVKSVLPGMTVLVGTSAGAYDVGTCRVRAAWTSTLAKIGEGSEIAWTNGLHLTVIDDFLPWARHVRIINNTPYMDHDIAYINQHTAFDPVPILGPDAVVFRSGGVATVAFSSAASYVPGGSVSSRHWSVSPSAGVTISDAAAVAPSIIFANPGSYRVSCAVTSGAGKTFTGHRSVIVDPPPVAFALDNCGADFEQGYWSYSVTLWDAGWSAIRDRQKVILYARDVYQGEEGSVGYTAGRENIIAQGWIEGETITHDPAQGAVSFLVTGLAAWMGKIPGFPIELESRAATASAWTNFTGLTVDKALYHLFHWRSTLTTIVDVSLTGDTRVAAKLSSSANSLLTQAREIAGSILASVLSDRHGRLYSFVEYNLLPVASRAAVPTVMTITAADRTQTLSFERRIVNEYAQVDLSGIVATDGGQGSALFSLSPGRVFGRIGQAQRFERLVLSDQAQANALAGMLYARANNPFPSLPIAFAQINRAFDIAPIQRASLMLIAADNARGVGYSGHVVPGRVQYQYDAEKGILSTTIDFIGETIPGLHTNGDIPIDDTGIFLTPPPCIPPPTPPPALPPGPLPNTAPRFVLLLTSSGLYWTETFDMTSPTWQPLNAGFVAADFAVGFLAMDCNQDGRYFVATMKKVYSGLAGYSAGETTAREQLSMYFGNINGYNIHAMGCNPAADEVAIMAHSTTLSRTTVFQMGNSSSLFASVLTSLPLETGGHRVISWGKSGILATYATGFAWNLTIARFSLDGLAENYSVNLGGIAPGVSHARSPNLDDRLLTYYPGTSAHLSSQFITGDGEVIESDIQPVTEAAFDNSGLFIIASNGAHRLKSSDGGQTWADVVNFPKVSANNSRFSCLDKDRWVWAVRSNFQIEPPGVFYTPDFAQSFDNKTGNLLDFAGVSFSIKSIKVFP